MSESHDVDLFTWDTTWIDNLISALRDLPDTARKEWIRLSLKEVEKRLGTKKKLVGYIKSHFKQRTGVFAKSPSNLRVKKVRNTENRMIGFIHFRPPSKIKGAGKGHMSNKVLVRWLNYGTKDHYWSYKNQHQKEREALRMTKGIKAHHFMEPIQKEVDNNAPQLLEQIMQKQVQDFFRNKGLSK